MIDNLRVGLIGEAFTTVTEDSTARAIGSGSLEVYATPSLIALMESAAVSAVDPALEANHASVGIEVNVRHLAATPVGEQITAIAEITHIDGKRIQLEVRAWDENEMIGEGKHTRYVIDIDQFLERLSDNSR